MEIGSYIKDRQNLEAIYRRRKVDVVFSQQPIQPLATFTSGSQIQLVFQNSKHFLDLSKVQLFFRPVIQFGEDNGLTPEQRALLCMTPIDAQSMFTLQSVQINGNQICAQPQSNLQVTRSIFQGYWNNFISSKEKHGLYGDGDVFSSLSFGGMSGSTNYGLIENAITHPANGLFVSPGYTPGTNLILSTNPANPANTVVGTGANSSQFEADAFPRAIVSRMKMYYPDMNFSPSGSPNLLTNEYYQQQVSTFADGILSIGFPAALNLLTFPLMPLGITPSVAVYKKQQEMFQNVRMRFIQTCATPYLLTSTTAQQTSRTLAIQQFQGTSAATATNTVTFSGNPIATPPTNLGFTNNTNATQINPIASFAQVRMSQGRSVQNYTPGQPITRNGGSPWEPGKASFSNAEQYTEMAVSLGELSCELRDIGLLCMENAQVIVQLQVNIPQNCISAYLQSGLQADPYNSYAGTNGAGGYTLPTCYNQFLQACLIGNTTTLTITDTTCRIEYVTYEEQESYQIMKALMYQPKPYVSLRQQYDVIPNAGIFTQRLSIGASSMIQGILILFVPARTGVLTNSNVKRGGPFFNTALPQDSVVSYQGCQPPMRGDLRSTYLDSYYQNLAQIYAEVDGKRYAAMDLNLSNPGLSTYLVTQAGLQTTLNKYVHLDLQSYLMNRFFYWIPINVSGSQSMRIQDQQIVITANIDDSSRVAYSKTFNEITQGINGQFGMLSFALTMQSLVDCSYVKV